MHPADTKPTMPILKLFPRLAMAHASRRPAIRRIDRGRRAKLAHNDDSPEGRSSQVRARLLRMIVDNEQVRRNVQRPSAS
jgi:hypothetical protein